jgi:predicted transcriptional regulator
MSSYLKEFTFNLPEDLTEKLAQMSDRYGESPIDLVIAAVEHFTRIPEEQRKAVLKGVSLRRRG